MNIKGLTILSKGEFSPQYVTQANICVYILNKKLDQLFKLCLLVYDVLS